MSTSVPDSIEALRRTIDALESQRPLLGDESVDLALAPVRARLAELAGTGSTRPVADGAERKVVTVVFADISGFTAMSERMDSESVHATMNALFDRLVPVIESYGGTIDKFIGDEIMALFGAPLAIEHHAEHALRACLDLFAVLAAFNDEHGTLLGLHVGVNSGLVVAGDVGSASRRDYSVMGDVVNVAARLEGASETGEILVGPATHRLTVHRFDFAELEPLALKGKRDRVPVYRLLGLREYAQPFAAAGDLLLDFVGRHDELRRVEDRLLVSCRPVAVLGDAGVGKSRLVAEVRGRGRPQRTRWFEAHALAFRSGVSYGVVHELIDDAIGAPPNADLGKISARLDAVVADAPAALDGLRPFLRQLRGLPAADDVTNGLDAVALRRMMARALRGLLRSIAGVDAVAVVIEDIHWSDPSSLALLRELIEASDESLGVVMTTRPDSVGAAFVDDLHASAADLEVVRLTSLTDDEVELALTRVLVAEVDPSDLRRRIRERAEGNPFFLVSFLRSIVDQGAARVDGGSVHLVDAPATLTVPESLLAVVGARVDRLPEAERATLRLASVLGRRFDPTILGRFAGAGSEGPTLAALDGLERRELIEPLADGRRQFVHAVVHDVAYEGLLVRERRRLHAEVARLLEGDEPASPSESWLAALAGHHEAAGHLDRAAVHYERAATCAALAFANEEAAAHLAAAVRLSAEHDPQWSRTLQERRADLLHLAGRFDVAEVGLRDLLHRADPFSAARLHRKVARSFLPRQATELALQSLTAARELLDEIPVERRPVDWWREHFAVENETLWTLYLRAETVEMRRRADRLADEIERRGEPRERGEFDRTLALLELREGRMRVGPPTVARAAAAVTALRAAGDRPGECFAAFTHAFTLLWSDQTEAAQRALEDVLDLAQRIGDSERSLLSLTYLAVACRLRGDTVGAEAYATAARTLATRNRSRLYESFAVANLAWARWRRDPADPGVMSDLDRATEGFAVLPSFPFVWAIEMVRLMLATAAHRQQDALAACDRMTLPHQQRLVPAVHEALERVVVERSPASLVELCARAVDHGYI